MSGVPVFPSFDAGAVRGAARWLGTSSVELSFAGSTMSGMAGGPEWSGAAHDRWVAQAHAAAAEYRGASESFSQASQALHDLATEVEEHRREFERAMDHYAAASSSALFTNLAIGGLDLLPDSPDTEAALSNLRSRLDDARAEAEAALAAARAAVEAAHDAGRRASAVLGSLGSAAAGSGAFAGFSGGSGPLGFGSRRHGPEQSFLVMLFGSVADNYIAGRAFQMNAMRNLGLQENFETFRYNVNGRSVATRPDAFGNGEMFEFKNTYYQYASRQIQAQLGQAAARGEGYTLVVRHNTKVSASLQEMVRNHPYGGEIVRMQRNGDFTTLDGRVVQKVEDGGWRYRDPDDPDEGSGSSGGSGGGLNHPAGQEADRISVDDYRDMPSQSNMTPIMPWPSFPMPLPAPAPAPVPLPIGPRLLPIP
ncbi:MAG TPA: putative toxin [Actinomycetota bacterium]|nr:putative toxin [Actinomycetota bacterium]